LIKASNPQGIFYGVCTLKQIISLHSHEKGDFLSLPFLEIEDKPDIENRGCMLDISRDKVYTMETMKILVDRFADLKINQLQLYMEHTFAYRGHEIVHSKSSPFTGEEILLLDELCRKRFIKLVPNQNSFGHMERWLLHDSYSHLAECPQGTTDEPFLSLCPTDEGSLHLLKDLYSQLLPHFSTNELNVGLDETFDLGKGRSKEICEQKGTENVYVDFLCKIAEHVKSIGKRMQFWGDIILSKPEVLPRLPKDVICLIWGYEGNHPFSTLCPKFADLKIPFYVCPGTSSWNSLIGRTKNALENLKNAAKEGSKYGAEGYLITDWGDRGHFQTLPISFIGFVAGASFSWNSKKLDLSKDIICSVIDEHVLRDESKIIGSVLYDLGSIYTLTGENSVNSTFFGRILTNGQESIPQEITVESLAKVESKFAEISNLLSKAKMGVKDGKLIEEEIKLGIEMSLFAIQLTRARISTESKKIEDIERGVKTHLILQLDHLIQKYENVWMKRNRVGGLTDSVSRMIKTLDALKK